MYGDQRTRDLTFNYKTYHILITVSKLIIKFKDRTMLFQNHNFISYNFVANKFKTNYLRKYTQ